MTLLLHRWADRPEEPVRTMLDRTLHGMAWGGVYDQLGGGFHRYSVDAEWIVPHFEKMSYDNSELLKAYLDAYALFGTDEYAVAARGIVGWVLEVMADPEGGYAASQDADVGLDDDGDYFTWTRDEAAAVLTPAELEAASAYYDIGTAGEMHHNPSKNVLFVASSVPAVAAQSGRPEAEVRAALESAQAKLRAARDARPAPFVDRTRYANWSAMMASALLRAGAVLGDARARRHALLTLARLRSERIADDAVAHTPGGVSGLLDDQVQVAAAGLDAYEATGESEWLGWVERLMDRVWADYWDTEGGGLFDTARGRGDGPGLLPAPAKPVQDAPTPSPNGVAGVVLARLHELTGDARWRERGLLLVRAFAGRASELGLHAAAYLLAVDWHLSPATHLVVVGEPGDPVADQMHADALATFVPRRVVRRLAPAEAAGRALPAAMAGMVAAGRAPRGYACTGTSCRAPADTAEEWVAALAELGPPRPLGGPPSTEPRHATTAGSSPDPAYPLDSQRRAIEAPLGPVLVVAGPGAGKTFCLIARIRHLIACEGIGPSRICAVTFTNKAADEIAARLLREIGPARRGDQPRDAATPSASPCSATTPLAAACGFRSVLRLPHFCTGGASAAICGNNTPARVSASVTLAKIVAAPTCCSNSDCLINRAGCSRAPHRIKRCPLLFTRSASSSSARSPVASMAVMLRRRRITIGGSSGICSTSSSILSAAPKKKRPVDAEHRGIGRNFLVL